MSYNITNNCYKVLQIIQENDRYKVVLALSETVSITCHEAYLATQVISQVKEGGKIKILDSVNRKICGKDESLILAVEILDPLYKLLE
jgi:hypothetical protein